MTRVHPESAMVSQALPQQHVLSTCLASTDESNLGSPPMDCQVGQSRKSSPDADSALAIALLQSEGPSENSIEDEDNDTWTVISHPDPQSSTYSAEVAIRIDDRDEALDTSLDFETNPTSSASQWNAINSPPRQGEVSARFPLDLFFGLDSAKSSEIFTRVSIEDSTDRTSNQHSPQAAMEPIVAPKRTRSGNTYLPASLFFNKRRHK